MLVLGASFLNPLYCFFREFVERRYAKFEVFLLRVFDLVVADAVKTLDKHHHRWHACSCDFGGVVQRAARQAVNFAAGFADGFVAQQNEFIVERARGDLPEPFPGNFHAALLRKCFAGIFRLLQHFCQRGGVEMTLIQRDAALGDHAGDNAGFGCARADGANAAIVARASRPFVGFGTHRRDACATTAFGDAIDFRAHFRGGKEGILAAVHRRAAGVRGLALERNGVPRTAPSGKSKSKSTGPCSMCNSRYAAAFLSSLPLSFTRSKSTPTFFSASGNLIPSLSTR